MAGWIQGLYTPKKPDKYLGDLSAIRYMSSWELEFFEFCDNNPNIIKWASEEIPIQYYKPDPRTGNLVSSIYYPDIFLVLKDKNGKYHKHLIEIKPFKQSQPSKAKKSSRRMQEQYTYIVNQHKWDAAEKWCKSKGIEFRVLTEKNQFF